MAQATSPRSRRPTMRPEPLSVWNERRMLVITSALCGWPWSRATLRRSPPVLPFGFLDEDREQLGVELFLVGLRELQGFGGRRRCFSGLRLDDSHRFLDGGAVAPASRAENSLGLLPERAVGNEVGIPFQRFQVLLEVPTDSFVGRLFLEGIEQCLGFLLGLFQFLLDRAAGAFSGASSTGSAFIERRNSAKSVAPFCMASMKKPSAERRSATCSKSASVRCVGVGSEAPDLGFAFLQGCNCGILTHDHQRTDDLMHRRTQRCEFATPLGIPEETVQNLLDLCEVALDFLRPGRPAAFPAPAATFRRAAAPRTRFGRIVGEKPWRRATMTSTWWAKSLPSLVKFSWAFWASRIAVAISIANARCGGQVVPRASWRHWQSPGRAGGSRYGRAVRRPDAMRPPGRGKTAGPAPNRRRICSRRLPLR